jgi:spore germination cell wall hydrolase CwlJ-like protein
MRIRLYLLLSLVLVSVLLITQVFSANDKFIQITEKQLTTGAKKQVSCLAENIYFESAYEPKDGRVAVALVTLNRVNDPRYPDTICDVVKQRTKYVCQFSWYCERNKIVRNERAYQEAKQIALFVYANYERMKDHTHGALFYHADYVNPRWKGLEKTVVIGRHIFYRERDPS